MLKKIFIFIICLIPWFLSTILVRDYSYYKQVQLPFFAPPSIFYSIAWTIIYILIAYSIYTIVSTTKFKDIPNSYKISLLINYLFNQSFTIFFFQLHNSFLSFISCLVTFISSLFLYHETTQIKEDSSKYLDPYIILSLFATILSLTIYVINSI